MEFERCVGSTICKRASQRILLSIWVLLLLTVALLVVPVLCLWTNNKIEGDIAYGQFTFWEWSVRDTGRQRKSSSQGTELVRLVVCSDNKIN